MLAAYNVRHELVGLAPLYMDTAILRGLLRARRMQFIGNCWHGPSTVRTEYLDFIAQEGAEKDVAKVFFAYLMQRSDWDEFILSDLDRASPTYRLIKDGLACPNTYVREAESYQSFYISTQGGFSDYLAGLGSNTRLRLFNRRTYLAGLGEIQLTTANPDELDQYFATLNSLHRIRWNKDVFQGKTLVFHREFAARMAARQALNFSLLIFSGRPESVLYDFRINKQEYNIQAGFNDKLDKKVALGFLHLGYAVEAAFRDRMQIFDLLVGGGKKTQFKAHLTSTHREIVGIQLIRSKRLKVAYGIYDRLSPRLKRSNREHATNNV